MRRSCAWATCPRTTSKRCSSASTATSCAAHLEQRKRVPPGQYAEVRYEDLVADPEGQLHGVYAALGLPGWDAFAPRLRSYLDEVAAYRPHTFQLDRALAERIAREWEFAFDEWGYDPMEAVHAGE